MEAQADLQEQRREAYIAAARTAFFAHGYAGTTMSSISSAVGGSKTTLWTYFPSKQDLFSAVLDDIIGRYGTALAVEIPADIGVVPALRRFVSAMMDTIMSPPIIDLHRLVTGEAGRFPELAALFWDRGPKRGRARLEAFMTQAMARGELRVGDSDLAARQLHALCLAGSHPARLLGLAEAPTPQAVAAEIDAALDSFMRAWEPS